MSSCRKLTSRDKTLLNSCRKIFLSRLDDLGEFYSQDFIDYYQNEYSFQTFEEMLEGNDIRELSGHVSQRGLSGILITSQEQDLLNIDWVMSREDARGIGSQLLAYAHKLARQRNSSAIELSTTSRHPALVYFYEKRGYNVVEEVEDEVIMRYSF